MNGEQFPTRRFRTDSIHCEIFCPSPLLFPPEGTIGRNRARGLAPSAPTEASLRRPQEETGESGACGSVPGVLGFNVNASKTLAVGLPIFTISMNFGIRMM